MWHWDQGRLDYFQFDELRKIAKFAVANDLRTADRAHLADVVGLPFLPISQRYRPWRNYSRIFQLAMIAVPSNDTDRSELTEIGKLLAKDGQITTDEYLYFLAQATTDPSPALRDWNHDSSHRYPLLFALRFMLARATQDVFVTSIANIIATYETSGLRGDEDQTEFLGIINGFTIRRSNTEVRQAAESLKVMAQLSYLSATKDDITISLASEDAEKLFGDLKPISGTRDPDGGSEILRISALFPHAIADLDFDYSATALSDIEEAGFSEGGRVRRAHLTIERNGKIRSAFFDANPSTICDFCGIDTARKYPWTPRVLDIHHLLPLCSGARTSKNGTLLEDLVANCPTCHRAVHRYYDDWLSDSGHHDFADAEEARRVYCDAKFVHRDAMTTYDL